MVPPSTPMSLRTPSLRSVPHYVSPLSGHAILCSQGKWGRGAVPLVYTGVVLSLVSEGGLKLRIFYFLSPSPTVIPCPTPRVRTVALGRAQFHPQEVEPALPGRRVVPALAASLSSLARPPPPPAPLQARGGVALPVEGRGGPVATAAGLPPVSPYVPTPLSEAALAYLSPPPTTDPKPPPGSSVHTPRGGGCMHISQVCATFW